MSYTVEIDLHEPLDEAIDSLMGELEEALENIRKYRPEAVIHHEEIDVHELLAEHQAIAVVWDIGHVKDQRPDLSDEQAWAVLVAVEHDRLNDPLRESIRLAAEQLYPSRRTARAKKAGEIIAATATATSAKIWSIC